MDRRIGLALGSGSARGWSHIGVVRALSERNIRPDIVCGSSIGSLVGASLVCGHLGKLETWARQLSIKKVLKLMDFGLRGGGLIQGERLMASFMLYVDDVIIEDLPVIFGTVATDLEAGREFWFKKGSLLNSVRASIALPGLFTPHYHCGRWLVDGGLVNPVPVSMCRALGADIVIGVNLNGELAGRCARSAGLETRLGLTLPESEIFQKIADGLAPIRKRVQSMLPEEGVKTRTPGMWEVMTGSIDIMQDRITKSRLAGDPPDILVPPRLGHMGLMEFDRADEAIEEGISAVGSAFSSGDFLPFDL